MNPMTGFAKPHGTPAALHRIAAGIEPLLYPEGKWCRLQDSNLRPHHYE
jgi:hypothetical protein